MGVYGPDTDGYGLKATVLESGKKCINWVSVGTFETLSRPLWVNLQP